MVPLIVALWACSSEPVPPELMALGDAVSAWEQGRDALAAGDPDGAVAAFGRARQARPKDALLAVWSSQALAEQGDLTAAARTLDEAVLLDPSYGLAHVWRARIRARLGDAEGSAEDVVAALRAGAWTPRMAARDPDIAALLTHPAFDLLPDAPMHARWVVPEGLGFAGSEIDVRLEVDGVVDGPISVAPTTPPMPVALVRVVEDEGRDPLGDRQRQITWTWRVLGAANVVVPPSTVSQGAVQAVSEAWTFRAASADEQAPPMAAQTWPVPSAILGDAIAPTILSYAGDTWAAVPPGGRVVVQPEQRLEPAWNLRRGGEPVVDLVRIPPGTTKASIRIGRDVVLDRAFVP